MKNRQSLQHEDKTGESDFTVFHTSSKLTSRDIWDHFLARIGVNRQGHRVKPGLYSLGEPTPDSPVFVTANYTLSFDALRSNLDGIDSYILVLDTRGINVWCAAAKGVLGTGELVERIKKCNLSEFINHKRLILPQLGAAGISAPPGKKNLRLHSGIWSHQG